MSSFVAKNTLRVAALLLGGALAAIPALAQQESTPPPPPPDGAMQGPPPGGPHRGGPERRAEMLQQRLGLSTDQTVQVKAILADGRAKMEAARAGSNGAPPDRKLMRDLMEAENAKVRAVLTDDQRKKFDAMEAERRERMREGRGNGPGGPQPTGDAPPTTPQPAPQQ